MSLIARTTENPFILALIGLILFFAVVASPALNSALGAALLAAAILALAAPVLLVALYLAPSQDRGRLGTVAALLFLECFLLALPRSQWLAVAHWNWQGKILEILWPLLYIAWTRSDFPRFGVRVRLEPGSGRAVLTAGTVLLIFVLVMALLSRGPLPTREHVWFQLTMPGMGEELAFRGVFQSLLNDVFPGRWRFWGAKVGWGWVLTAVLFGLGHALPATAHGFRLELLSGAGPSFFGLFAGWVRERSGSIWPGVVIHNGVNALPLLVRLAIRCCTSLT